jgi:hypothetical protein
MKITTKMLRSFSGEWWGKASKKRFKISWIKQMKKYMKYIENDYILNTKKPLQLEKK